nr:lysophospholipid acyltransferase family protein [Halorhodospira halophila]
MRAGRQRPKLRPEPPHSPGKSTDPPVSDQKKRRKGRKKKPPTQIHHPAYWPTWLGLGLLRLLALLPIPLIGRLGDGLGMLLWAIVPSRRHIVRTNLCLAFPEIDTRARRRLERAHFRSAARGMLEGALAWWGSMERLAPYYAIEGLENIEAARQSGRGIILLMPHYTTMEMCGKIIGHHVPDFHPVYKPTKDAAFNAAMVRIRKTGVAGLLTNDDMRGILRVLRNGQTIWYAPDQDFGRRGSVFAPFMGVATSTLTTTARLAARSGAPLVPLHCERLAGNRWHVRIDPALEDFPCGDDVADATRINAVIEAQVRRTPEQYLWLHRRFKTRPDPDAPNPYARAGRRD